MGHQPGQQIYRNFNMDGAGALTFKDAESIIDRLFKLICGVNRPAERGASGNKPALIGQFVQPAFARTHPALCINSRNYQHGDRTAIGLPHGSEDIRHARAGDDKTDPGFAADPCIAIGHETGALFMARGDMGDPCCGEATIKLNRVHAGDTKNSIDATRGEELRDIGA